MDTRDERSRAQLFLIGKLTRMSNSINETKLAPRNPRDEKLQAIMAMLGPEVAARLLHPSKTPHEQSREPIDAERVAWQQNRLIQHLRTRTPAPVPLAANEGGYQGDSEKESRNPKAHNDAAPPCVPVQSPGPSATLPVLTAADDLAAEHPAVIAQFLRHEPQMTRVSVLRVLPGPVARAVMKRLRDL